MPTSGCTDVLFGPAYVIGNMGGIILSLFLWFWWGCEVTHDNLLTVYQEWGWTRLICCICLWLSSSVKCLRLVLWEWETRTCYHTLWWTFFEHEYGAGNQVERARSKKAWMWFSHLTLFIKYGFQASKEQFPYQSGLISIPKNHWGQKCRLTKLRDCEPDIMFQVFFLISSFRA